MDGAMTERAVERAELAAWEAGPAVAPAVLAVHGVTASHVAWRAVTRQLPELRLVAPDLRGRGAAATCPGRTASAIMPPISNR